jgi:type IX secretion system substrate protein
MKTFYKSILLLIYSSTFIIYNSFSQQAPGIEWQKCLGGTLTDEAIDAKQTNDGGYIIAGSTDSNNGDVSGNHGNLDAWIVKLDSLGNIQWQKCLGGSGAEKANAILIAGNEYVIAGYTSSNDSLVQGNHGYNDFWLVKIDSIGNILWQNCFGGPQQEEAYSVVQTYDGGFAAVGYTQSSSGNITNHHGYEDVWLIKINASGALQWQSCYGGSSDDWSRSLVETADKGLVIAGGTLSNNVDVSGNHGGTDVWIIKVDSVGNLLWQTCYGGTGGEGALSINKTNDSGFIVACGTSSTTNNVCNNHHGTTDYWVLKLDSAGNQQLHTCFGGSYLDDSRSIAQINNSSFIISGSSSSTDFDMSCNHHLLTRDFFVVAFDTTGNLIWRICLGGTGSDQANVSIVTSDGGFFMSGITESNNGDVTGIHGAWDAWIVKLSPDTITGISPTPTLPGGEGVAIAPNPSSGIFKITFPSSSNPKTNYTLEVISTLGQTVYQAPLPASPRWGEESSALSLDLSFLPKGIYVLHLYIASGKINAGASTLCSKLIIE